MANNCMCGAQCPPGIPLCRSCYEAERDTRRDVRRKLAQAIAIGDMAEADRLAKMAREFLVIRRPPLES